MPYLHVADSWWIFPVWSHYSHSVTLSVPSWMTTVHCLQYSELEAIFFVGVLLLFHTFIVISLFLCWSFVIFLMPCTVLVDFQSTMLTMNFRFAWCLSLSGVFCWFRSQETWLKTGLHDKCFSSVACHFFYLFVLILSWRCWSGFFQWHCSSKGTIMFTESALSFIRLGWKFPDNFLYFLLSLHKSPLYSNWMLNLED